MSWLKRLFQPTASSSDIATVSQRVKDQLREIIASVNDIDKKHRQEIYEISLLEPGNLHKLCGVLNQIAGMTSQRSAEIARSLSGKAKAILNQERDSALGITHAIWMYANAPCMKDPKNPSAADVQQDSAHRLANGKRYEISKGLYVDGKWTRPRAEEGCKCVSRAVIPGFE